MNLGLQRMIDHRFTAAQASEYLVGQLSEADGRRIERHMSICPPCRALLGSLRRVTQALGGCAASPRASVADSVLERLRRES